jgi:POT family proton-dependent oligopeptide transporter
VALGTTMSGRLAEYYDPTDERGFFLLIGGVAVAVGLLVLVANRPIRRLMAGVH